METMSRTLLNEKDINKYCGYQVRVCLMGGLIKCRKGLKSPERFRFRQAVLKSFAGPVIFFRISGDLPALVPISTCDGRLN